MAKEQPDGIESDDIKFNLIASFGSYILLRFLLVLLFILTRIRLNSSATRLDEMDTLTH